MQLRVREMIGRVRYPATNEEEGINFQDLINEKSLAVGEQHLSTLHSQHWLRASVVSSA